MNFIKLHILRFEHFINTKLALFSTDNKCAHKHTDIEQSITFICNFFI